MNEIARSIAPDEIGVWRMAVEMQQQRIVAGNAALVDLLTASPAEVDFRLYAVAVRNLRRAVDLASRMYPEHQRDLRQVLERFDEQVPRAQVVRDIFEHFDEYAKGRGNLAVGLPPAIGFSFTPDGTAVHLDIWREDGTGGFVVKEKLRLDTTTATAAALQMADDALKLISSDDASPSPSTSVDDSDSSFHLYSVRVLSKEPPADE